VLQQTLLIRALAWLQVVAYSFVVLETVIFLRTADVGVGGAALFTAGFVVCVLQARRALRADAMDRAVIILGCGFTTVAILAVLVLPFLYMALALLPIVAIAFALPYLDSAQLRRLMIGCWMSILMVVCIGELSVTPAASAWYVHVLRITTFSVAVGLIAALLWHFHHQLTLSLARLATSEARHRTLLQALPDVLLRMRADGACLDSNNLPTPLIQRPPQDARITTVAPESLGAQIVDTLPTALATQTTERFVWSWTAPDAPSATRTHNIRVVPSALTEALVIIRDVTEQAQLDQMKQEFVAIVSHELRTPLTSIRGSLGLILGGATGALPPQAHSMISIAHTNCERLLRLVLLRQRMAVSESTAMRIGLFRR
jgi:signal transduction histidine kinase